MIEEREPEIWKDVVGWEGLYQVSSWGSVRSLNRGCYTPYTKNAIRKGKLLAIGKHNGYYCIPFFKNSKRITYRVHRLVAQAFIPNPENLEDVMHLDDNGFNNYYKNLAWGTHDDNMRMKVKNNRQIKGENVVLSKLKEVEVINIRNVYNRKSLPAPKLAQIYKVSVWTIRDILNRKTWKHL